MDTTTISSRFCTPLDGLVEAKFRRDQLREELILTLKALRDALPPEVQRQLEADDAATVHFASASEEYHQAQGGAV